MTIRSIRRIASVPAFVSGGILFVTVALLAWRPDQLPQAWPVEAVPIAFWSWRGQSPNEDDVRRAKDEARVRAIFLRAGQIDYDGGKLRCIRVTQGRFPRAIELHLVYNGTRSFLQNFESIEPDALAKMLAQLFAEHAGRAAQGEAVVVGLQLDIDAPTRLLKHYERMLRKVRGRLSPAMKLSITGLPTWMDSPVLENVLTAVDFWVPQCYGATIPERLNQAVPISSPRTVESAINRARRLGQPFYAGLAAYGYAIHYARDGSLVALRGDLDPALVARHANLEMIERRPFTTSAPSEWRYVYRARSECVIDGLVIRAGECLMLDMPNGESLRASARIARQKAGKKLLGICVFRLPARDDYTALTIAEIAAALNDQPRAAAFDARAEKTSQDSHNITLRVINNGATSSLLGDGAMTLELQAPTGSARVVSAGDFISHEALCLLPDKILLACAGKRADILRFATPVWRPGDTALATIRFAGGTPERLPVTIKAKTDNGDEWREERVLTVQDGSRK